MPATLLSRRMSAEDASFLYFETAGAPLHIGSVGIFEGKVDFPTFFESLNSRMHIIPRYRQKAVTPPFYAGHPTWEDDPQFSLDRHLSLRELPAPGTREQLQRLCAEIFQPILPRDRPLWDIAVIHGVDGGQNSAIVSRVHHCMVDGVSGIELLLAIMDLVPDPEPTPPPAEPWQPAEPPGPMQSWADAMFDQWDHNLRAFNEAQAAWLDPRAQFRQMTALARAMETTIPATVRPRPATPWNKRVGANREFAWTEINFQEVRSIRGKLGGTVNDVVLTVLGGALGRYLAEKGTKTDGATLRFMIPVNVRSETEQGALGNRVSMMLPNVPVGIASPADRLVAVREETERLKSNRQSAAFETMLRYSENIPAAFYALAGINGVPPGGANLVCTNVPGPLIPLYCAGQRLLQSYPMLPLAGDMGLGVAIMSYDKALYLGVTADPDIINDVDSIRAYIDEEFRLLRYVADVPVSDLPDFGESPQINGARARNGVQPRPEPSTPIVKERAAAPSTSESSTPITQT
jgi:diacylglycerol O-acyltransferase / wax synthase